ncbi:MAG: UDP-2,3-diacylglucosamine diphosphatase LpxI [Bacillota bacterium]|nr:UDP-2,3-diacylglucosamine diphosphatase LpxI [Bacillota bacterium]
METIGIVAGAGRLPVAFGRAAREQGLRTVVVNLAPHPDPELARVADELYSLPAGFLDRIIRTLQDAGAADLVLVGKVSKELLYQGQELDWRFQRLLERISDRNDDSLLRALVEEFEREGLRVHQQTLLIGSLLPGAGVLSRRSPDLREREDMRFGFERAKAVAGLDIGQTVVVKEKAVLAVEAIEGTDAAIRRGGTLGRGGAVVVKVSKPNQDLRFDIPTVGLSTIRTMIEVGASALGIEAGKTFLLDREETLRCADEAGIAVEAL